MSQLDSDMKGKPLPEEYVKEINQGTWLTILDKQPINEKKFVYPIVVLDVSGEVLNTVAYLYDEVMVDWLEHEDGLKYKYAYAELQIIDAFETNLEVQKEIQNSDLSNEQKDEMIAENWIQDHFGGIEAGDHCVNLILGSRQPLILLSMIYQYYAGTLAERLIPPMKHAAKEVARSGLGNPLVQWKDKWEDLPKTYRIQQMPGV